tara:strand:+ start:52 stop:1620 length:1569 start_codon:yes stop_codon:yes gene_type:complete
MQLSNLLCILVIENNNNMKKLLLFGALGFTHLALATTITVSNNNDSGVGSLRDAISNAVAGDTIVFDANTDGVAITLTSGELLLNKDLDIIGNGMNTTIIDGSSTSRIFHVDNSGTNNDTINISSLTVQNGYHNSNGGGIGLGGAAHTSYILNLSIVEVKNCEAGNYGGGIHIGIGSIDNCYIHDNSAPNGSGGGVEANWYPTNLTNTTISNNTARYVGGISFNGPSNMTNCTIYGNTGTDGSQGKGGCFVTGQITNCTISNNTGVQAGGLVHAGNSNVKMYNNIIYGNNGGDNVVIFIDSFEPPMGSGLDEATYGKNIVGSCSVLGSGTVNCPAWFSTDNPQFDPAGMQPNSIGIPSIAVICGSVAIDAANENFAPATDQNGTSRYSLPDIGAVESGDIAPNNGVIDLTDQLVSAANGASYQWLDCNNNYSAIPGENSQSFSPSSNGSYAVQIYEVGGICVDTSACYTISVVGISEYDLNEKKELIIILDFMGRETNFKPNTPLIFIYSDGTRERVMKIEE